MTVSFLLVIAAFICTIASALGRCPAWVPIVLICLVQMLALLPVK